MTAHPGTLLVLRTTGDQPTARTAPGAESRLGLSGIELVERPLLEWIHPDDRSELDSVLVTGCGRARTRHATGEGGWLELDWDVRTDQGTVVALGRDQTTDPPVDTSRAPKADRASLSNTLETMARIVENKNPELKCSILLVNGDGKRVTVGAGPSLPAEYNAAVEGLEIGPMVGSCGTAAYWNVPVIVEDIQRNPLWRDLVDAAGKAGVAAYWSHPITAMDGEVLGAMALYDVEPKGPTRS